MVENREVKSDVFSMLMEDKRNALQVYNALNGSGYTDPELIEMVTLEKGISLTIRNDAAFILDTNINIYEHQSTYSPNIPLRSLLYLVEILKPKLKNRNIYSRNKVIIPTPHFAVFYNVLEEFMRARGPEVIKVMTLDMTFEHREEMTRQEAFEEGKVEGKVEGKAEGKAEERANCIVKLLLSGMTAEKIEEICGYSLQEVMEVKSKM